MNDWIKLFLATIALAAYAEPVDAQYACGGGGPEASNPCPMDGDIVLPMPDGLDMVFRAIMVPGGNFWGDTSRNVVLGHPDAPIFEGERLVSVAGSFPTADDRNWQILIGKYEVSVRQFATIIGDGDLAVGLERLIKVTEGYEDYIELVDGNLDEVSRDRLLARPITDVWPYVYDEFLRRYNDWCYDTPECFEAMPKFGELPGFFRLPTETEWEFAARAEVELNSALLPFDPQEARRFAHVSGGARPPSRPTSIGRYLSLNGIHDMFGNVAELVDGRFHAELGQGKPGMRVARGGDLTDSAVGQTARLRVSFRKEITEYRLGEDGRMRPRAPTFVGIRLAIGSQTEVGGETWDRIEQDYAEYRSTDRLQSASGDSTRALSLQAGDPLLQIETIVDELEGILSKTDTRLVALRRLTDDAKLAILRTTEDLARQVLRNTVLAAAETLRASQQSRDANENAERLGAIASANATLVETWQNRAQQATAAAENSALQYANLLRELSSYREVAVEVLATYNRERASGLDQAAFDILERHLEGLLQGGGDPLNWQQDLLGHNLAPDGDPG